MIRKNIGLLISILLLFSLAGCIANIDGKHNGLSIGFNYQNPKSIPFVVVAVRSDKVEFNIDEVILDFYIGWQGTPPPIVEKSDEWDYTVGFAIFVSVFSHPDEKNFYLDEILADDFISNYKVNMTKRDGKQFQGGKSYQLPLELFDGTNEISFGFATVQFSQEKGEKEYYQEFSYRFGFSTIRVEYINENRVRLSK